MTTPAFSLRVQVWVLPPSSSRLLPRGLYQKEPGDLCVAPSSASPTTSRLFGLSFLGWTRKELGSMIYRLSQLFFRSRAPEGTVTHARRGLRLGNSALMEHQWGDRGGKQMACFQVWLTPWMEWTNGKGAWRMHIWLLSPASLVGPLIKQPGTCVRSQLLQFSVDTCWTEHSMEKEWRWEPEGQIADITSSEESEITSSSNQLVVPGRHCDRKLSVICTLLMMKILYAKPWCFMLRERKPYDWWAEHEEVGKRCKTTLSCPLLVWKH